MTQQNMDIAALEQMNSLLIPGSNAIEESKVGEPFPSVAACLFKFVQDCELLPKNEDLYP